uniref:NADH-ubiquinone oxidoreductase chain 5 n=1 Tax=Haustorioides koreanus TaxID=2729224 RepID=A0A6M3RPY9_9CRUS|nr:NADH dehydrogenase subunit 5 [Haustorioides koreanus]
MSKNIYSTLFWVLLQTSLVSFLMACWLVYNSTSVFVEWQLFNINSTSFVMSMIFDWMSLMFLSTVFLVSGSICAFSAHYMKEEKNFIRFMLLLLSFVASMVLLIISPNMVSILLGWDGLGLTSYALVIYYQNESSASAGMLTVLSNRIGDVCILISIALMMYKSHWNFIFWGPLSDQALLFFVVLAAMTKSAQIPFSAWLPAAMAAPTPVSSLVHSSTLVTAGVYLLIRFSPILEGSSLLKMLLVFSVGTLFMSGWSANFEPDMKKIIALSTLSQLGLMMMVLSLGMSSLAFFHLISHAMFKSTLFMCAGVIIHMSDSTQDSRKMSTLSLSSPFLMLVFSLCNLALLGFPFLSGFYSKDILLELTFSSVFNQLVAALLIVATGFTVSYSLRIMFLAMNKLNTLKPCSSLSDTDEDTVKGVLILSFMSITLGFIFSWVYSWSVSLIVLPHLSKYYVLMVFLFSAVIFFSLTTPFKNSLLSLSKSLALPALTKMWFLPFLSTKKISLLSNKTSFLMAKSMDSGWSEMLGPQGLYNYSMKMSAINQQAQMSPMVKSYLLTFILAFWLFLLI